MSNTSITKKAYARGIGEALQRQGRVQFPNTDLLKEASDLASQFIRTEPLTDSIQDGECLKVAQYLVEINDGLKRQGKTASWPESVTLAVDGNTAFGDLIYKVAEAVTGNSTVVGDADHSNTLDAAASVSDIGAKEKRERPEEYAHVGQGNTNFSEDAAARQGKEEPHPGQPTGVGGAAGNSVTQASKSASTLQNLIHKLAEGSPVVGVGDHTNDLNAAATVSDIAAQEQMNRPEEYANVGQGNTNFRESAAARQGEEQPHPKQPMDAPGTNSVTEASKVAAARDLGRQSVAEVLQNLSQNFA